MDPRLFVAMAIAAQVAIGSGLVTLDFQDVMYMPVAYNPRRYAFNVGAGEQCVVDPRPQQHYIYVIGGNLLHMLDFTDPTQIRLIDSAHVRKGADNSDGGMTDVEACGDFLAFSYVNNVSPEDGTVEIYRLYQGDERPLEHVRSVIVGPEPDMIKFTKDCGKLVVAVEGEPRMIGGEWIDYEGMVTILSFRESPGEGPVTVNQLDFTHFNSRADEYMARGVRWVLREDDGSGVLPVNTFSQDLEPEYVAFNKDETTAYVMLQEANAVAIVDLVTEEIKEIEPLGYRSWKTKDGLDASDRDQAIDIKPWDVMGAFQPDGFQYITINGQNYLLTADEGDAKDYEKDLDWTEDVRARTLYRDGRFDDSLNSDLQDDLNSNSRLGRLKVSRVDPRNSNGKLTAALSYGTRSFSLFKVNSNHSLTLTWSSDSMLERIIEGELPEIFNSNNKDEDLSPEESFDLRSDNGGPEPEMVEVGTVNGKDVIFVGLERPGMVTLWTLDAAGLPRFESIHYNGGYGSSYEELYDARMTRDLDPEDLRFLSAAKSPNGQPMLLVSGSVSGTLSIYNVVDTAAEDSHPKKTQPNSSNFE